MQLILWSTTDCYDKSPIKYILPLMLKDKKHNQTSHFLGKKAIVTGASGFIGSHLCHRLSQTGVDLHGISRKEQQSNLTSIRWWQGDLADITVTRRILTSIKPDFIFHLASPVVGARDLDIVPPTFYSNLASTVNILTVATEIGCTRVILVGSLEEPDEHDITAIPCSPYAAAKWACSGYARMFHALYNTPVSVARLFMVYGPGQQDLRKLIPYVTLSLLRNEVPKLTSGYRKIDWIYVEDVVEGLLLMGQGPSIEGCTLDLGSGSLATIRTVVEQLIVAIGSDLKPIYGALPVRAMEQVRTADTQDTFAKIGWRPRTDLKDGLQSTVGWYREHYHALGE